jgi:diguanylate cyclase (GGDEF)-like protein
MENNKFIVYADINCPFCFSLHERLTEMDYIDSVDWRMIEHAPQIKYDTNDLQVHAELSDEIRRVRDLASEIPIIVPPGRPNSGPAIRLIKACEGVDPEKARYLRTYIYRALWRDGLDVSDPTVLEELVRKAGLEFVDADEQSLTTLKQWQEEWETGDFSRNIPVLVTDSENKLLGLPSPQIIDAFLSGQEDKLDYHEGAFCYLKPKEKVLIVSTKDKLLDCFADALEKDYQLEFAQDSQYAIDSCRADNPPDLVLMDTGIRELDGFHTCLQIKDHEKTQNISVILFGSEKSVDDEVKAFDSGAADYITLPCAREVILARVRVQLRLKRTTDLLEQYSRLDGLTEVPNRREFDRIFEKEWRRSVRSRIPLSLILIDVDFFKPFNDNYGHMDGDQCLKQVAQTLEQGIYRAHDTVARFGGEEFVIILPDTEFEGACSAAEKFRQTIEQLQIPHAYSTVSDYVTISLGVATAIPSRSSTTTQFIDVADTALYSAKSAGRNCVRGNTLDSDPL